MSGCTAESPCAECKRRIAFIAKADGITEQEAVRRIEKVVGP